MVKTSKEYPFSVHENPLLLNYSQKIKDIKDGDLFALLSVCSNEELDPLVTIIIEKLSNFLVIDEDYKRHKPCHTKYYKVIGNEIRSFGGNSLMNLARGGQGPAYDEIVEDVCKKIGIAFVPKNTVKNEKRLLDLFLDRQLKSLNKEDQDATIADARNNASKKVSYVPSLPTITLMLARGPASLAALPFSFMDPAMKATVPCVLHIAYLRKKFLDNLISSSAISNRHAGKPNVSSLIPTTTCSKRLDIGSSESESLLSLIYISEPSSQDWNPVNDSLDGINRLNPLLQAFPSLVTAGEVASTRYMEVVINGPLLKAKGKEGYRLITMIDKKPSHGTLLEPSTLSKIVNPSALLQVASVALAQKHLADISAKLSDIKMCVDRISQFQVAERRSNLKKAIECFEDAAPTILRTGNIQASLHNQIEHQYIELCGIQDHLLNEIQQETKNVFAIKDKDTFGSEGMQQAIKSHQELLADLYQQLMLCIRARACGWQLLAKLPCDSGVSENRKFRIQESLSQLNQNNDLIKNTDLFMRKKIKEMSAVFNTEITLNERKLSLLEWTDTLLTKVTLFKETMERDIHEVDAMISVQTKPTKLFLKVENGIIIESCAE